jgi:hypothetical protein
MREHDWIRILSKIHQENTCKKTTINCDFSQKTQVILTQNKFFEKRPRSMILSTKCEIIGLSSTSYARNLAKISIRVRYCKNKNHI